MIFMQLINVHCKELGWPRCSEWFTAEAPDDMARAVARKLVSEARQNAGVWRLRVTISPHPTKS